MDISDAPPLSDSRFPEEEILVTPTPLQKTNDGFIDILARDITMASDSEETPPPKKRRIVDARTTTHAAASREEDDFLPESYLKRLKTMVYDKLMVVRVYEHDLEADYDPADSSPMKMSISSHLYHRLYSHQKVGVKFLYSLYINKIGGLLADEMGLGKTIQIISLINSICSLPSAASPEQIWNTRIKPILIVCPATLVGQWRKEFLEFDSFMRITILNSRLFGTYKHEKIIDRIRDIGGVFLSSFEFLRTHLKFFKEIDWFYEILDEGQKIRNPDAQITLAIKSLKTANRLLLSGSPIQNDLREFWSIFDFVQPGILGTLPIFMSHFGDPITASGMARVSESAQSRAQTSLAILKSIVAPHMIRRTKRQIHLTLNLPDKQEQIIICPLSLAQYQVYVDFLVEHDVEAAAIRRGTKTRSLWFISVLSKICNHPDLLLLRLDRSKWPSDFGNASRSGKLNLMMEILTTWISEQRKVLIFSQSVQMLDIIQLTIESVPYKFLRMDGHTPVNTRLNTVDEFNVNPEIPIMLLTTRVGGVGLNLVAASRVIIFDPDWNPTVDNQAQERAWRIGQEKDVVVYRLLCKGTIEEKIYKRQIFKLCLSDKILTNSNIQKVFSVRDFSELFKFPPAPKDFQVSSSRLRSLFVKAFSRDFTAGLLDTPVPRVLDNIKEIRSISASEPRVATLPEATLPEATLPEATLPEATLQAFSDEESEDDKSNKDDRANEEVPNILKLLFESDLVEVMVEVTIVVSVCCGS